MGGPVRHGRSHAPCSGMSTSMGGRIEEDGHIEEDPHGQSHAPVQRHGHEQRPKHGNLVSHVAHLRAVAAPAPLVTHSQGAACDSLTTSRHTM